ncbi:hypothetical protein [Marinifilum fragile]|uniref:hypothetical protein n=1 Tax=Marinifilum fragile TaxID=570161 RepID=UPI0006D0C6E7|nr:hypothetical protein [Marinifilum fragile]
MRKLYTLVFSMILIMGFAINSIAQDQGDATAKLTSGKWVNHADGYIPNPIGESNTTVKRYKTIEFKKDNTFTMDSIKQRFTGRWVLNGTNLTMTFNPKEVTHLQKNTDLTRVQMHT